MRAYSSVITISLFFHLIEAVLLLMSRWKLPSYLGSDPVSSSGCDGEMPDGEFGPDDAARTHDLFFGGK